jgi:hypothetical protein
VIRVPKVADVVGNDILIVAKPGLPRAGGILAAILTNFEESTVTEPGPAWVLHLEIGEKENQRTIKIDLAAFLSGQEYGRSFGDPLMVGSSPIPDNSENIAFLFRDQFFLTERTMRTPVEHEEVVLRIKKAVYDAEGELMSLRSYVSNVEAAIEYQRSGPRRDPIPDDVKLVVWSRDGGVCTRCGSNQKLHFDHIIPVVKGGGNDENNIQLLCQTCNLRKSDRIAF